MAAYVMVVQSNAKQGRDAEYNEWYDKVHLPQLCSIPGIKSGRRFNSTPFAIGSPGQRYLAIYEVETDDLNGLLGEIGKRAADGRLQQSDALDAAASVLWFYQQH
jgi:hypothetical protein